MIFHTIKNDNTLIEKKVNYFADYFCFVNERIGKDELHVIETPLSIFENILIQLTDNIDKCYSYIDKYISNELITNYQFLVGKKLIDTFFKILKEEKSVLVKYAIYCLIIKHSNDPQLLSTIKGNISIEQNQYLKLIVK